MVDRSILGNNLQCNTGFGTKPNFKKNGNSDRGFQAIRVLPYCLLLPGVTNFFKLLASKVFHAFCNIAAAMRTEEPVCQFAVF